MADNKRVDFSLVIPVLNEEESLPELVEAIESAFEKLRKSFEVVFIDDGSGDHSLAILKELSQQKKYIRIFSFRRNLGKSPALSLGFQKSTGRYVITMDADLQDDPENISNLHQELIKNDYDMVTGWRKTRKDKIVKIISSKLFNHLVSFLFGIKINDLNSGLKIYKSETAKELKLYGGMHRFIPVIVNEMGFSVGEKEITHKARKYGVSKYKSSKILTDIPDLITIYFIVKYNRRPLHFFGKIGTASFLIGFAFLIYLSYLHFIGEKIGDRPLLIFGVLLVIAGIQIIFTGLIADLIVNLHSKDTEFPIKYES